MDWSSGFFISPAATRKADTDSFEPLHTSAGGCFMLFRGNAGGKFRAFKALKPEFRGVPLYEDLLKKEFEIGSKLDHPNIRAYTRYMRLDDIGSTIEMEWIDGVTLNEFVCGSKATAMKLICELCDALTYVHSKQIIHRDLKPSNILITHNGNNLKLIDFSFSDTDDYTLLKTPAGTLNYASPEQIAGDNPDCRSDIYSLGAIIKEILPNKKRIAARCMRADRGKRFQNASEVKEALTKRTHTWPVIVALLLLLAVFIYILTGRNGTGTVIPEALPSVEEYTDTTSLSIEDVFKEATRMMMDADNGD